jgi:ATPase subunit of ABC transporter with duplicated ATPase domains
MILGRGEAGQGTSRSASTVMLRYLDQSRAILDDTKSVVRQHHRGQPMVPYAARRVRRRGPIRALSTSRARTSRSCCGECSGGMRNRVLLAKMLREPANVI